MPRKLRSAAVLASAVLLTSAALSQPASPRPANRQLAPRIVILTAGAGDRDLEPLRKAISAHLSPYDVAVEVVEAMPVAPGEAPEPVELARRTMVARDAMAVVWVDATKDAFTALIGDAEAGSWTLERSLPPDRGAWMASCDGLASLLHAALLPGLRVETRAPSSPPTAPARSGGTPGGTGVGTTADAGTAKARHTPTGALGVLVNLGYGPVILNARGEVQHGARPAIGASFSRGFELVVGLDLLFPFEAGSDAPGTGIRLVRWPFRIAAGWSYSFNKVHVGARLGFVLDSISIRGLDGEVAAGQDADRVNPGLMTSIRLRVDLVKEFSFFMDVTADWYYRAFTYEWSGQTVLEYGAIQTGLFAGVSVQFDLI
jgi:hypothetical protein